MLSVTIPDNPRPDLAAARPAPLPELDQAQPGGGRRSSGPSASPGVQTATSVVDLGAPSPAAAAFTVQGGPEAPGEMFNRIWRVIQWDEAVRTLAGGLPYIEGLAVVGVQMRTGRTGERPTVIVTQQDPTGELIHAIEGPVDQVEEVLRRQPQDVNRSEATRTPHDYVEDPSGGVRRTLRVLTVAGKLSADSLNTLARMAIIR